MKLSIATLAANAAFSAAPVKKTIEWKGHTFETYIRHLSYQTAVGDIFAANGRDHLAARIASSVCDEQGNAVFTIEDITGETVMPPNWKAGDPIPEARGGLDPTLTNLLIIAIGEVQNAGKKVS